MPGQEATRFDRVLKVLLGPMVALWVFVLLLCLIATSTFTPESPESSMSIAGGLVVTVLLTTVAAFRWERVWPGVWIALGFGVASTVVLVASVAYWPCAASSGYWVALPSWVLRVFFGDYETEGPGMECGSAFNPTLNAARTLGIGLTVAGAASLVLVLARRQIHRLVVRFQADVDVVVGLHQDSLPLIGALVAQGRRRPRRELWVDPRPGLLVERSIDATHAPGRAWWRLTGLRPGDLGRIANRRTRAVVVEADPGNPHIAEAERLGAIVISGDAADPAVLGMVATRWRRSGRRVSVRRLYAVDPHEGRNLQVARTLRELLEDARPEPHVDDVVPRVVVRMSDARDARLWRVSQIQGLVTAPRQDSRPAVPALVSDAFSIDGLAADVVCDLVLPQGEWLHADQAVGQLVLVGEGSLALSVMEELAWRQWCRFEVASLAGIDVENAQPRLARVTLAGPNADLRAEEWRRLRPPLHFPQQAPEQRMRLFTVESSTDDPELLAASILTEDPTAIAVFLEHSVRHSAAASRLARRFPGDADRPRITLRGAGQTFETEQALDGGLLTFAPSLARMTPQGVIPPNDSVSRLARQQHQTMFRASSGWPDGNPNPALPIREARITRRDWEDLPPFFQEDNVRQHWQILTWFVQHGYQWESVSGPGPVREVPEHWAIDLRRAAEAEYERWRALRARRGWWTGERNDSARLHPELAGWQHADQGFNTAQVQRIVDRLWGMGLALTVVADDRVSSDHSDR